jgi:hypothetical protein
MSSTLSGTYKYVFIPANEEAPMEQREGDKSGGLQKDSLVQTAKDFFFHQSGGAARAEALERAPPQEQQAIAQKMRAQILAENPNAASQLSQMNDEALLELVRSTQASPSCEIIAVTIPTRGNNFHSVSMYASDNWASLPINPRATALMQACGHAPPATEGKPPGVYGDVFVGRCQDDEESDIWQRIDLNVSELNDPATQDWCAVARSKGGGGGSGAAAASLGGIMQQTVNSSGVSDCTWSQTEDEVEVKFAVASGTKPKYVKVNFAMNSLKVTVAGQTLLNGKTGGAVNVDESTYTLQDAGDKRELCVLLAKNTSGVSWPYAVQPKT